MHPSKEDRIIVETNPEALNSFFAKKYVFDRWIGWGLLIITAPITLFFWALVKLTSEGPGFYLQERVGLNGRVFKIVKLRSMVKNAEKPGEAVWCVKHDCRVTWLGAILRKLHLDELPQAWNVANGDMTLVGPRPERPELCPRLAEQVDDYYRRNSVKPGITGLAQINLPPDEDIEDVRRKQILDLHYIDHANAWLDFRMILATALRMIGIKGEVVMRWMKLCRLHLVRRDAVNAMSPQRSKRVRTTSGARADNPIMESAVGADSAMACELLDAQELGSGEMVLPPQ